MDPSAYGNLLTQQGEALQGAANVPFLGTTPPKPNPVPYTQRGGSILAVSGLLVLGGFIARNRNMDLPSSMMYGTGALVAGYGIARLT